MSIDSVGSAQRRRIEDDTDLQQTAKAEAPKTPSLGRDYERLSAPPTTIPETPTAKSPKSPLASIASRLKDAVASIQASRKESCEKASEAQKRLADDLKELRPKLEKMAKDMEALGRKLGPAGKDILEFAHGLYDVGRGVTDIVEGIEHWSHGGAVEIVAGAADIVLGIRDMKTATEHWSHDKEMAKTAGPELAAVLADMKSVGATVSKIDHDAKDAAGVLHPMCLAG